jgi:hyaluronoglucosaminidase
MCNRLYAWLLARDPACTLNMCPGDYHGQAPFSTYLVELGERLHPAIDIFYTGPDVCSPEIGTADAHAFAETVRRPPLIWDNYPVNDLAMRPNMHIGPIRGREATLYSAVRGIVVNPMLQPEASKIPLLTFADYFRDPHSYDPWRSWEQALLAIGGQSNYAALLHFTENSLDSCLRLTEEPKLVQLTNAAIAALHAGEHLSSSAALQTLSEYLNSLDEACYVLKNRMHNFRLRDNLLPWVEALDEWAWVGKRAVCVLEYMESGKPFEHYVWNLKRSLEEIKSQSKRTGASALLPLATCVLDLAHQRLLEQSTPKEPTGYSVPAAMPHHVISSAS